MRLHLQELFKEKHYKDLDGGILEGFGRLLKFDLRVYVYPTLDTKTGKVITAENAQVWHMPLCHSMAHCTAIWNWVPSRFLAGSFCQARDEHARLLSTCWARSGTVLKGGPMLSAWYCTATGGALSAEAVRLHLRARHHCAHRGLLHGAAVPWRHLQAGHSVHQVWLPLLCRSIL